MNIWEIHLYNLVEHLITSPCYRAEEMDPELQSNLVNPDLFVPRLFLFGLEMSGLGNLACIGKSMSHMVALLYIYINYTHSGYCVLNISFNTKLL